MTISQKWKELQPTKASLVWTAAGASVLTMIVGFTWGGWETGNSARSMASDAADASHAELAAAVCVENFRHSNEARVQLQELVELTGYRQRQFVESAEWAVLPGGQGLGRAATQQCADQVAAIDLEELPTTVAQPGAQIDADGPEVEVQ